MLDREAKSQHLNFAGPVKDSCFRGYIGNTEKLKRTLKLHETTIWGLGFRSWGQLILDAFNRDSVDTLGMYGLLWRMDSAQTRRHP